MSYSYFLPYQLAWINDTSRMKIYEKSRRVGITYGSSYKHVQKCLRAQGRRHTQWVSSRDLLTAKEYVTDYVAMWAQAANVVAAGLAGDDVQVIDEANGISAFVVTFGDGSRILSLSSTPEAFAGKGGDVYLDEVDLHKDSGRLLDMALPCTLWGGSLEVVSAYRVDGSRNTPFARLVSAAKGENSQGWSLHRTTILAAVEQGLVEKINEVAGLDRSREQFLGEERAKCRTEAAWKSQYLCEPQDDGGCLLTYELIASCEDSRLNHVIDRFPVELEATRLGARGSLYLGMDIARRRHLSVIWLLERIGHAKQTRAVHCMHNEMFRNQKATLYRYLRLPGMAGAAIDATGIGANLAEDAMLDFQGRVNVEEVTFNAAGKNAMGTDLMQTMQDRALLIPADPTVREDLHQTEKVVTAGGVVRLAATETEDGHADRMWALALAERASRSMVGAGYFAPAAVLQMDYEREAAI